MSTIFALPQGFSNFVSKTYYPALAGFNENMRDLGGKQHVYNRLWPQKRICPKEAKATSAKRQTGWPPEWWRAPSCRDAAG